MDALPSEEPVTPACAPVVPQQQTPPPTLQRPKWRAWSKRDDFVLINKWEHGYEYLSGQLGRSRQAIIHRARKLNFASLRQGVWSLQRICRETGYNWKQVYRARDALGQLWPRTTKKGIQKRLDGKGGSHFRIRDDQVEAIVEWLSKEKHRYEGKWSVKYGDHCLNCKQSDRPHAFRGLCTGCYSRVRSAAVKKDPVRLAQQRRWHRESQKRHRGRQNEYVKTRRKNDSEFRETLRERQWWNRLRRSERMQNLLSALLLLRRYPE